MLGDGEQGACRHTNRMGRAGGVISPHAGLKEEATMWYDLVVLAILAFCTIRGAAKGIIWQLAGIVGVVLCFAFAETIAAAVGPHVSLPPPTNHWVVMFGAYLGFSLLSFSMARSVDKWIEKHEMKEYNQHLGAIFGFAKGVVICLVMTFFIVTMSASARESLKNSHSGKAAAIIMDRLHPVMPDNLHDALAEYIHQLDSDELDLQHTHDHEHLDGDDSETDLGSAQSAPPLFGQVTNSTGTSTAVPSTSIPSGAASEGSWLPQLRGVFDDEIRRAVAHSLQDVPEPTRSQLADQLVSLASQMSPSDLLSLQQQLSQAGNNPLQIANIIGSWTAPQPTTTSLPSTTSGEGEPDRWQQLLADISGLYGTRPESRRLVEQNIEQSLTGIPDEVALAVLEDWRADLFFEKPDPDPATDNLTLLEDRMYRQLQLHGVRLDQVSAEVQRRLRGVVER